MERLCISCLTATGNNSPHHSAFHKVKSLQKKMLIAQCTSHTAPFCTYPGQIYRGMACTDLSSPTQTPQFWSHQYHFQGYPEHSWVKVNILEGIWLTAWKKTDRNLETVYPQPPCCKLMSQFLWNIWCRPLQAAQGQGNWYSLIWTKPEGPFKDNFWSEFSQFPRPEKPQVNNTCFVGNKIKPLVIRLENILQWKFQTSIVINS